VILKHCDRAPRVKIKAAGVVSCVGLWRVFGSKVRYFMVTVAAVDLRGGQKVVSVLKGGRKWVVEGLAGVDLAGGGASTTAGAATAAAAGS
jgi:hypothetical protein